MPEQVGRSVRFALDGGERKGGKGKRLHHKSNIHLLNHGDAWQNSDDHSSSCQTCAEEEAAALSDAHWDIPTEKEIISQFFSSFIFRVFYFLNVRRCR